MSVSRGGRGITLSLKDLRIAKIQKNHRIAPCGKELEAYLSSLAMSDGDDANVPPSVVNALEQCLGQPVSRSVVSLCNMSCICRYSGADFSLRGD
jgi:hypothetical protein